MQMHTGSKFPTAKIKETNKSRMYMHMWNVSIVHAAMQALVAFDGMSISMIGYSCVSVQLDSRDKFHGFRRNMYARNLSRTAWFEC